MDTIDAYQYTCAYLDRDFKLMQPTNIVSKLGLHHSDNMSPI